MYRLLLLSLIITSFPTYGTSSLNDCREKISDVVCLVDPVDDSNPYADRYSRPCLDGTEKYIKTFERHFDSSSQLIQRMYCSLDKIWIEKSLHTTAYAVPIKDYSNQLVAGAVGFSQKFIDADPKIESWLQEKEESSFGKNNFISYIVSNPKKMSALHYAINHEFGHLFDYANNIQEIWPKDESFTWARELCFYSCAGDYLSPTKAKDVFKSLLISPFPSTYASTGPKEDWAETFALIHAQDEKGLRLKVKIDNDIFDLAGHLESPLLKQKRDLFRQFIRSPKYP